MQELVVGLSLALSDCLLVWSLGLLVLFTAFVVVVWKQYSWFCTVVMWLQLCKCLAAVGFVV